MALYVNTGYWIFGYAEGDSAGDGAGAPTSSRRPQKRRIQVEVDGEVYEVRSESEAMSLLDQIKAHAQAKIDLAKSRSANALKRPARKIMRDAEKMLSAPDISSEDIDVQGVVSQIVSMYQSALKDIEIGILMRKAEIEQDDEEVLLLAASL